MATDRQFEANRRNAGFSTGPRSLDGKNRSRGNALRHGLSGTGTVADDARREQFEQRKDDWAGEIRPATIEGAWALDRAVSATFQIEECENAYEAIVVEQTTRARLVWDEDRRVEAVTLAARLPKRPDLVARQLEASRHGVEWMVATWSRLAEGLDESGGWTDREAAHALDLLGIPVGLRERRTPIDAPDGNDRRAYRLALIVHEVERLKARSRDALEALDILNRRQAEVAALVVLTKTGGLILRYQRDAWRRYRDALRAAKAPAADPQSTAIIDDDDEFDDTPEPVSPAPEPAAPEAATPPDHAAFITRALKIQAMADAAQTPEEHRAVIAAIDATLANRHLDDDNQRRLNEAVAHSSRPRPTSTRPLNRHQRRAAMAESRRG